jgi:uncharacterized damage-inducible protein DinB
MSEVNRIAGWIHAAYEGPAWHGPALCEVLTGVTADTAAQRPISRAHTIREIVLHITVWISVATRRLEGAAIPTLAAAEDWPAAPEPSPETRDAEWQRALERLAEAQRNLEAAARKLTDDRLRETVLGDRPYSIYTMLHGVVHHNLYHAGQIALIKKAVH